MIERADFSHINHMTPLQKINTPERMELTLSIKLMRFIVRIVFSFLLFFSSFLC